MDQSYFRKARLLASRGAWLEAASVANAGLAIDSGSSELWKIAIESFYRLHDMAAVSRILDEALEIFDGGEIDDIVSRAELLLSAKRFSDAMIEALRVITLDPSKTAGRICMAAAAEAAGNWPLALEHYLCLRPETPDGRRAAAKQKRLMEAISCVDQLMRSQKTEWREKEVIYPHAILEAGILWQKSDIYASEQTVMHVIGSLGAGGAERQLTITAMEQSRAAGDLKPIVAADNLAETGRRDFFRSKLETAGVSVLHLKEYTSPKDSSAGDAVAGDHLKLLSALPPDISSFSVSLYLAIKVYRPAIVHLWLDVPCVVGGLAAHLAGAPHIVLSTRNMRPTTRQPTRPYLRDGFRWLSSLPKVHMINNSHAGAQDYVDWIGDPDLSVTTIHNGYDFSQIRSDGRRDTAIKTREGLGCDEKTILIGGVMRLAGAKRPVVWLESCVRLIRRLPNIKAVLIGDGPLVSLLQEKIEAENLTEKIEIVATQSPVEPWIAAMDLMLLVSSEEGLPNVLIEAQALGTPVAATDAGGSAETFLNGRSGVILPAQAEPAEIEEALLPLLGNPVRLEEMGKAGPAWVASMFSIDSSLEALRKVYSQCK